MKEPILLDVASYVLIETGFPAQFWVGLFEVWQDHHPYVLHF